MPKKTIQRIGGQAVLLSAFWLVNQTAWADFSPVSDDELAEITGQAYISIDKTYHPVQNNLSYTRINLGMDIETKLNADLLELGRYERPGEAPGSSDIKIKDFGLGYIHNNRFFQDYSYIPSVAKPGGGNYQDGEIVPFKITDPYLEFAFDENTGELIGARIGFGKAMGLMSGNIQYLTGNVNAMIVDRTKGLTSVSSDQKDGNLAENALLWLTPFLVDGPVSTTAVLVDGQGNLDPVRASMIGMANGSEFMMGNVDGGAKAAVSLLDWFGAFSSQMRWRETSSSGCGLFWLFSCNELYIKSEGCRMFGVLTCFPLSNFGTLPVGKLSADKKKIVDGVSGMFLSFQTRDGTPWSITEKATDATRAQDFLNVTRGAFFNVPNGAVEVNLSQAYKGTPMVRQEFIDRGRGLF